MPELPEVETTRRGIAPHIAKQHVAKVDIRQAQLRWPIEPTLPRLLKNQAILNLERRGKYLIFQFPNGHLLWHLGMSGSLRVLLQSQAPGKHDHVDLVLSNGKILRFNDPRRFGAVVWTDEDVLQHKLLAHLGPEPLTEAFNAEYLFGKTRKRQMAIKPWIMDSKIVVGVGNIYANEALFNAGIHPLKATYKLTRKQCERLVEEIKTVLANAIQRGGTTLRDFVGGDGKPGYFAQELNVYGRGGQPCKRCNKLLLEKPLGQRATVYCTVCQK
ncbi:Formamidopyrimidine-DNA glycosylase [Thalassocella blandensis]|nr:Formamidopyrimidine-DNA glycosylase [Thalassocella blandensis]